MATNFFGKAYSVSTSTTSANQTLSPDCRAVRVHVTGESVFMAIGDNAQIAGGTPSIAVAETQAAFRTTNEISTITLSGFYKTGDKITVVVASTTLVYAVRSDDQSDVAATTLDNVALQLQSRLARVLGSDYTVTVSGAIVTIERTNPTGTPFDLTAEVESLSESSHYLAVNNYYDIAVPPSTSVAFKTLANTGAVYISELA